MEIGVPEVAGYVNSCCATVTTCRGRISGPFCTQPLAEMQMTPQVQRKEFELEMKTKATMSRFTAEQHEALVRSARMAHLPRGVYLAATYLRGGIPPPAPPAAEMLPESCQKLLQMVASIDTNTIQISKHCHQLGNPLSRLAAEFGVLDNLGQQARAVGLRVKRGEYSESRATYVAAAGLAASAESTNELAHSLNKSQVPELSEFHSVLTELKNSLAIAMENKNEF